MKTEIVIYAPSYDPNSGGSIVLHKLCDSLNKTGKCRAFLLPGLGGRERHVYRLKPRKSNSPKSTEGWRALRRIFLQAFVKLILRKKIRQFRCNPAFDTPVVDEGFFNKKDPFGHKVVVYAEVVNGNPLRAKHVVRWLLHNPGFHNGEVHYGIGELHFRFSHETIPAIISGLFVSDLYLTILHIPWEYYNMNDIPAERDCVAYSLRKGAHKSLVHDVEGSILIDGRPHAEVAAIFKRSRLFISYDSRSAYSQFASLCGCDSVIVPDEGVSEEEFFKSPESRYGVSYGFEGLEAARSTRSLLYQQLQRLESDNLNKADAFLEEVQKFFRLPRVV